MTNDNTWGEVAFYTVAACLAFPTMYLVAKFLLGLVR